MDKIFLIDKNVITYNQLIDELNEINTHANLSQFEQTIISNIKNLTSEVLEDYAHLISNIKSNNKTIQLNTSGTTAEPKVINHTFENLTRNIKVFDERGDDVWGFTYNPTKMAGYQVLLQCILNKNTIVNLFKYNYSDISSRIEKYSITHISATPTFYKLLLSENKLYPNVKQISLGGEGSNIEFHKKIKIYFPNANIKNIYASTEVCSLLATNGELFKIPNQYQNFIKISDSKLLIHKTLVGESKNLVFNDDWYDTGDLVEIVDGDYFKIIGRDGVLINIGGYQINPIYIESKVSELDYVKLCKVYSKSNSLLGNILFCDLVISKNISIFDIKKDMKGILNEYEVPSKINIVDELIINESGKISRK